MLLYNTVATYRMKYGLVYRNSFSNRLRHQADILPEQEEASTGDAMSRDAAKEELQKCGTMLQLTA